VLQKKHFQSCKSQDKNHKTNDKRIRLLKKEILCTNAHAVLYTSTSLSERPDINVVSWHLCSQGTVSFSKEIWWCTRHVRCDDVRKIGLAVLPNKPHTLIVSTQWFQNYRVGKKNG